MTQKDRDKAYEEARRCLAQADAAFARAGAQADEDERQRLIDEAEAWLARAEQRLARLADRPPPHAQPHVLQSEGRSFEAGRPPSTGLVWRRPPKA